MSFVDTESYWYAAWVPTNIYAISYYIGPRHNGTRLYQVYTISMKSVQMFFNSIQNFLLPFKTYTQQLYPGGKMTMRDSEP